MYNEITVLMSSYNGEKYIEKQIDSILCQKGCHVKLIVRDDGSTDKTKEILHRLSDKGIIEYYDGTNMGPALSFMEMIKNTPRSQFYAFADQDDEWLPEKLIKGIEKITQYSTPALYCSNMRRVDNKMNIVSEKALPDKVSTDFESVMTVSGRLFGCTMVFNDKMVQFVKEREIPQHIIMHDLWLAMIASLHDALVYDNEAYINYRTHSESVTFSKNIPLHRKLRSIFLGSKDCISKECETFVNYVGEKYIKELEHWDICELLLNYKKNLFKKLKLQFIVLKKGDMSFKLRVHRSVQILFGKY